MSDTIPHFYPQDQNIPAASGIYRITCIVNKKIYIGSAVNLRQRWRSHRSTLQRNVHRNVILQHAWNKYGEQSFTFEILELVLPMSLTAREQYWFQKIKPFGRKGFNIVREAGSNVGNKGRVGQKNTPEAIEKMRQAKIGKPRPPETRERLRQANLGNKRSPESIEKQKQAQIGHKHTPETIEKIRQAKLNQSPETRKKISDALRGRKPSPQTIESVKRANMRRKQEKEGKDTA